ncbi:hypothetical protein CRG98_020285 [Punica granatum]|uniref:Uncharacterized protein n=1 Tax=Punica granatum TaxID=22663 RepID=A0A2I0JTV4_PUNGR|nr:hypothetical protein CRG98_020285 [Punica granatum]
MAGMSLDRDRRTSLDPSTRATGSREPLAGCTQTHACRFVPRLCRVVPSRSKGSSQPSPSPVKRWSRSEGRSTMHNHRFIVFLFTGFLAFTPSFLSLFRVRPGLGTFGSAHGHLDLPLRSPMNPISHRAVAGASVPTRFLETAAAAPLSGHSTRSSKPSLATLKAASPTLFLVRMDRPAPGLRLEAITPPRQDIMRIWRTLRPVDHAFIRGIIGDMVMFTETPVDWIFLRTATGFWNPEHAVFNFQGTELAPTIEEYTTLI